MNEAGRHHLSGMGQKVILLTPVRKELQKFQQLNHPEAEAAWALIAESPGGFNMKKGVADSLPFADEALRREAVSLSSKGQTAQFMTADMALAEALSMYPHILVSYLARYEEMQVMDWVKMRDEILIPKVQARLGHLLAERDFVLSASALLSPGIERFLMNLQQLKPEASQRPVLHEASLKRVRQQGHLPQRVLELLQDRALIRFCRDGSGDYATETALMDATYFARSAGSDVCILVAPAADLPQYYASAMFSHMQMERRDYVNFQYLNVLGEPVAYLNDWRIELLNEKKARQEEAPVAPKPQPKKFDNDKNYDGLIKTHGARLAAFLDTERSADFEAAVNADARLLVPGILIARRRSKPHVARKLLQTVEQLPVYCFNNWFKRSKNSLPAQEMLLTHYYSLTKLVVEKSADLSNAGAAMKSLATLAKSKDATLAARATNVIALAVAKGAPA